MAFCKVQSVKRNDRKTESARVASACLFGSHFHSSCPHRHDAWDPTSLCVAFGRLLDALCKACGRSGVGGLPRCLMFFFSTRSHQMALDHQFKAYSVLYVTYNCIIICMNIMLSLQMSGIKNSNFVLNILKDRSHTPGY